MPSSPAPPRRIGIETARALASAGADVTLAVRDTDPGQRTAADITATTGNDSIHVRRLDLADGASVATFVSGWAGPLHLLINNAGVMGSSQLQLTPDGWEVHFATNHLGHFGLALGLRDALVDAGGARIVSLSSEAHQLSPVIFDDPQFASRGFDRWLAYGQSKTANALFAVEAGRRWADDGITANAVHPGAVSTNLARRVDPAVLADLIASSGYEFKTLEQDQRDVLWRPGCRRIPTCSVALVEAGGKDNAPEIRIPAAFPALFKSGLDWDFDTDREPGLDGRRVLSAEGQNARRIEFHERDGLHAGQRCRL